jgi:hypothetical protein
LPFSKTGSLVSISKKPPPSPRELMSTMVLRVSTCPLMLVLTTDWHSPRSLWGGRRMCSLRGWLPRLIWSMSPGRSKAMEPASTERAKRVRWGGGGGGSDGVPQHTKSFFCK